MEWTLLVNKIEASIVETLNSRTSKFPSNFSKTTYRDEKMRGHWFGLKIPPFVGNGNSNKQELRKAAKWSAPKRGWVKLNFDGASRGNPGPAGIGCCLHDEGGRELARIAKPIVFESNYKAKILALIEGLHLCQNRGIHNLAIEGDSTIIINGLRKGSLPDWKLNALLSRALGLLGDFKKMTFNHIYREGNSRADALANVGADEQFIS
ncbi:uncharacterized protein LOC131029647 [Cryptomeria japonica]|uniref:uncharacterized protein LOC131029647 n=1 Tax=Cryptomeria japonica TaxID=3369 RepID=UPI0027DA32B0|nr:uncharacterized protein LOC131029647 [Cryptomeria japonica]